MTTRKNGASTSEYLTVEELSQIKGNLTMGDVWRVKDIENDTEKGAALYYHAAIRLGLHQGDMESFLDRVREADFGVLTGRAEAPDSPNS